MMNSTNGRDEKGRFSPGNAGGPGRPSRASESEYFKALTMACPPERWQKIVEKAVEAAEKGDDKARAWLTRYLIGEQKEGVLRMLDPLAGLPDFYSNFLENS